MVCKLNSVSFAFIVRMECKDNQKYQLHIGIILSFLVIFVCRIAAILTI
ncbi:hypothetical protein HMPREF9019_0497 [Hoylesella timonensis CRIS 5C-B1]|uniref:Uncharacterized protein n=1 Tax=Hoylesella timonensis CRIS 5C-B1 TaxID=679189 RepID=D1VZB0_9BACT|nr:hypothetical protein HMPREF9019_0497 [Hoylesella timonensis CRIS 5C-B1]